MRFDLKRLKKKVGKFPPFFVFYATLKGFFRLNLKGITKKKLMEYYATSCGRKIYRGYENGLIVEEIYEDDVLVQKRKEISRANSAYMEQNPPIQPHEILMEITYERN